MSRDACAPGLILSPGDRVWNSYYILQGCCLTIYSVNRTKTSSYHLEKWRKDDHEKRNKIGVFNGQIDSIPTENTKITNHTKLRTWRPNKLHLNRPDPLEVLGCYDYFLTECNSRPYREAEDR
jgi:hypothetical protein